MASNSSFTVPPIAQAPKRSLLVSFPGFTAEAGETARRIIDDNHKVKRISELYTWLEMQS